MIPTPISEYTQRRQKLFDLMDDCSAAIIFSSEEQQRNSDVNFPFRQNSNFLYLTGFNEPCAALILVKHKSQSSLLFLRPKDSLKETWDGVRLGLEAAPASLVIDQAYEIADFNLKITEVLEGLDTVYWPITLNKRFDQSIFDAINTLKASARIGKKAPHQFSDISPMLAELRLFKSPHEVSLMQTAANISAKAHVRAMKLAKAGLFEYQLEAELLHEFAQSGAREPAYSSIVGSGNNACILHYIENNSCLAQGDLVLIDAGCEFNGYAADITRTFPVSGQFTAAQKAIYQLVLDAQYAAIEEIQPGKPWDAAHLASVEVITSGLLDLGILHGDLQRLIEEEAYKPFYMHRIGHWLGLDVHDVGDYKINGEWRHLQPGMVLTIEPGIYINKDNTDVDQKWRGIGVRIEDDILVTENGHRNLTAAVPKEIDLIEALMEDDNKA